MSHSGAQYGRAWRRRMAVLGCVALSASSAAAATAAQDAAPAEVVRGARLQPAAAPLPDLTPFHVQGLQTASLTGTLAATAETTAADGAAGPPVTANELLLAAAAVLAFVALRYRG